MNDNLYKYLQVIFLNFKFVYFNICNYYNNILLYKL